jgi:superoxide dismutase, Fe-Mn family
MNGCNKVTRRTLLASTLGLPLARLAGAQTSPPTGPFTLPALGYEFAALEPHIDAKTMEIHHDKHHQAYVNNLNTALAKLPNGARLTSVESLLKNLDRLPEDLRTTVRNNAGGHLNHSVFWTLMKPTGGGPPTGPIADAIKASFGDFEKFKAAFEDLGLKRFGSGWVWLSVKDNKLTLASYANQDSPALENGRLLLGNDVWEHAYYLKYQNKRIDYLKAWWNTINWDAVNARLK